MRPGTLLRWNALKSILKSEIKDGIILLDIGSYDGLIAYNLKKSLPNLKITVIDIDFSGLLIAKKRGLKTLHTSATDLPLKNNSSDVVLCLDIIEHIKEDNKLIKEISRVLKKDGKIILTTPTQYGVSFPFLSKKKTEMINKKWGHVKEGYSLNQIKKLFENEELIIKKRDNYFNSLTRLVYRFTILSKIPLIGNRLFKIVTKLEPYYKHKTEEHIIIGKKVLT